MIENWLTWSLPGKSGLPSSISAKMQPALQISTSTSYFLPWCLTTTAQEGSALERSGGGEGTIGGVAVPVIVAMVGCAVFGTMLSCWLMEGIEDSEQQYGR